MRSRSNTLAFLLATGLTQILALSASAVVLMDEPFDYSNGGLADNSGGVWSNYSGGTASPIHISANAATLVHGSGSRQDVLRSFDAVDHATGNLYLSFSLKVNTAPTAGSEFFFGAFPAASISEGRGFVFLAAPATPTTNNFRLGLSNSSSATSLFSGNLVAGTQYQALVEIDLATNLSRLWVGTNQNAFDQNSPTLADSVATASVVGLARAFLRQGVGITTANSTTIDNVKAATAYSDLVVAVPEASALLFAGLASGSFGLLRLARAARRRE